MTILEEILARKREEVAALARRLPELRDACAQTPPPRGFARALSAAHGLAVIAEIKRASPSRGPLRPDLDPACLAREYEAAGADAVSVLTDADFFKGSLDDLGTARKACSLPVLRKDFIIDPSQVWEARAAGADAVLLIVAALSDDEMRGLHDLAVSLGMDVLVEVHSAEEARRALKAGARLVGINNRDLTTFQVDLGTTEKVAPLLDGVVVVSESGIQDAEALERVARAGAKAVLVGEALVTAASPGAKLAELVKAARSLV